MHRVILIIGTATVSCATAIELPFEITRFFEVSGQVRCADGSSYIPKSWVCDGMPDCNDGSDENCFECGDGKQRVPKSYRCDGDRDCADGSDESCFRCATGGRRVHNSWLCDGDDDCGDGSDERCSTGGGTGTGTSTSTAAPSAGGGQGAQSAVCGVAAPQHPAALSIIGQSVRQGHRIMGGSAAAPYSFPWQVQVVTRKGSMKGFCGGALVSAGWVLTAAHCVKGKDAVDVVLGAHWKDGGSTVRAKRWLWPSLYTGVSSGYDIALLQLKEHVDYTDKVRPVCLPDADDSFQTDSRDAIVTGWGRLSESGHGSDYLQVVVLRTAQAQCKRVYGAKFTSRDMCAAAPGKDSCKGDSGGPLTVVQDGRFVIAGVVSWGHGCGRDGYPGVYTHVPHFRAWIKQKTGV